METIKKKCTRRTKKVLTSQLPDKKISKFGSVANCLEGKVKEIGNVWDL